MNDACCFLCRGPHGVCLSRYSCEHHTLAQAQDDANHKARQTYRNPTADQAVARAMRASRRNGKER